MSKGKRIVFIICFLIVASLARWCLLFFIEESKFEEAMRSNSIYRIEEFLYKYPNTKHAVRCKDKIKELRAIEWYKDNSLDSGSLPWKEDLGKNYADRRDRCSIIILANSENDVIAYAKRSSDGRIMGHVYIKKGEVASFVVPEGYYDMWFYYGNGWNPTKILKGRNLELHGGFVLNESFSKDVSHFFQQGYEVTYTLTIQKNGNLYLKNSNVYEAL